MHLLLEHQQSQAWLRCEGSTPLHMASCLCGIPAKRRQGLEAAKLLLMSKASVFDKCAPVFLLPYSESDLHAISMSQLPGETVMKHGTWHDHTAHKHRCW